MPVMLERAGSHERCRWAVPSFHRNRRFIVEPIRKQGPWYSRGSAHCASRTKGTNLRPPSHFGIAKVGYVAVDPDQFESMGIKTNNTAR